MALAGGFLAPLSAARAEDAAARCVALQGRVLTFAGDSARITESRFHSDGETVGPQVTLPAHCEAFGVMHERKGRFDQAYAIHFHIRLPAVWNARMVFQGGGGSNGVVGDALAPVSADGPVAAARGYAVVSQDSGHDNAVNNDAEHNGTLSFGFDPQARSDYGHTSLKATADAAKAVIRAYYGRAPRYSYFVGCSKGGQEGMTFAQYYPDEFDGIIAAAPGFSLPRAAVAEAWDVQAFAALAADGGKVRPDALHKVFSDGDFALVRTAILEACDDGDGLKDGIVGDFMRCTDDKVLPQLRVRQCAGAKADGCLSSAQIAALAQVVGGARTRTGRPLYAPWAWPSGVAGNDWRMWKIGSADGRIPPLNVILGGPSLASVFTIPPTALGDLQSILDYQLRFDFDRDAGKIYAVAEPFARSAWADVASRSTDLAAFKAHGGRLIVPHGESDPVFSIKDTIDWWTEIDARNNGRAADFVRVFPVPGMCHCGGGQATDRYDMFTALVAWVEHGRAPDAIAATAGANSPWPGRQRPLCAYPEVARYTGGDTEKAASFACTAPAAS
jgi:feruloyl esterase